MAKGTVELDEDRCKGCGLCVDFCPRDVLEMSTTRFNAIGYRPVELKRLGECTGCEICSLMCPDVVFTVYRESKSKSSAA